MNTKPYLALGISIISVSFSAIFIVSINSPPVSPLTIALYRLVFTTLLLLPLILFSKKIRSELGALSRSSLVKMIGIGIVLALHFALWITSLTKTSVASSVILVTAHPILVCPLSHFFLKERVSIVNALGISVSLIGVGILVGGNYGLDIGMSTLEGNILAILGGICAGIYIFGGRTLRKQVSVVPYAFVVYTVGSLTLLLICLLFQAPLTNLTTIDFGIILLMAVISGILGHTLYNWSLGYIRASLASVALLGEPVGSALLAFMLPWISEIPTPYTLIGGTCILCRIYLTAKRSSS